MYFVYDVRAPKPRHRAPARQPDATAMWIRHASNRVYLLHLSHRLTFTAAAQVEEELAVCERKLTYWQRQPGWDERNAQLALVALRNQRHT